jgi:hypothetical protein
MDVILYTSIICMILIYYTLHYDRPQLGSASQPYACFSPKRHRMEIFTINPVSLQSWPARFSDFSWVLDNYGKHLISCICKRKTLLTINLINGWFNLSLHLFLFISHIPLLWILASWGLNGVPTCVSTKASGSVSSLASVCDYKISDTRSISQNP